MVAGALGLLACLALLLGASELLLRYKVAPQDHFWRHVAFFNAATSADAAFGDSHVARGFADAAGFANLAYLSESIAQIDLKARLYFRNRRPGRVILQADPHVFSAYRLAAEDRDYAAKFAGQRRARWGLLLTDPYYRRRLLLYWKVFLLSGRGFTPNVRFSDEGALLSDRSLAARPRAAVLATAASRVQQHRPVADAAAALAARRYAALVADLAARGARVCLVTFPVSPAYRNEAARHGEFERARGFFAGLADHGAVTYRSYWEAFDDDALFMDVDHLNEAGVRLFSPRVIRDCFESKEAVAEPGRRGS